MSALPRQAILLLFALLYVQLSCAQSQIAEETYNPTPSYHKTRIPLPPNFTTDALTASLLQHFKIPKDQYWGLTLQHYRKSPGGKHYYFAQSYKGIPIYKSSIKANISPSDNITSVMIGIKAFDPTKNPYGSFEFGKDKIEQILVSELNPSLLEIQPYYIIRGSELRPAYQAIVVSHNPTSEVEIYIDAQTGVELMRVNRIVYAYAQDTTAQARIFNPDPCTHSHSNYGDLFTDDQDNHNAIFEGLMDTVTLKGLTYNNGEFELLGPYVRIVELDPPTIAPVTSNTGEFFFTRDQSGFEDVMAYFHIDTFQRYIQGLGFTGLWSEHPLHVDTHGLQGQDNSVFISGNANDPSTSYLSFGEGGVDDAEDADVIIHEYGHALSFAAAPNTNQGLERRGLDEGIGDYFAAGYSYDLDPFRWDELYTWDGHNEFWPGRSAQEGLTYPPSGFSIYTYGTLWVSAMMDIRLDVGAEETDMLMLQAMYGSFEEMTLPDAAQLILDADSALFQGAHTNIIAQHFCNRNLLSGAICQVVSVDYQLKDQIEWSIYPNPSKGPISIDLELPEPLEYVKIRIVDYIGREIFCESFEYQQQVHIQKSLTSGMYLAQLWANGKKLDCKKLIVQR